MDLASWTGMRQVLVVGTKRHCYMYWAEAERYPPVTVNDSLAKYCSGRAR